MADEIEKKQAGEKNIDLNEWLIKWEIDFFEGICFTSIERQ
jgi:hypothetical protein